MAKRTGWILTYNSPDEILEKAMQKKENLEEKFKRLEAEDLLRESSDDDWLDSPKQYRESPSSYSVRFELQELDRYIEMLKYAKDSERDIWCFDLDLDDLRFFGFIE